ncbi:MAG: hypothetical protein HFI80_00840 [Lachnospiraceae bacterium]|uniref:Uncharacterized protein n=1 Tax=Hominisplanchenecus murintestinalis TaxID=2941517 RepID=A0AC61R1R3_9FIRM|nr:hypothetical protein [Hominisplanchenecus murintestinalis]MCI9515660.1 hypothetical protein [Lachnospiraceae bacterium]RKK00887.1 hypothetical protein D7Y41_00630 [Anaerotruncus sp. 1XD22-93]MCI9660084.1 hypothetical protein [Lachnospiraceae bacterium]NBH96863.1 hypothetical protein [Lachnospiraceae bacterium]NBI73924.1 hypothetical protein [Lachnospiraceae bacterium]
MAYKEISERRRKGCDNGIKDKNKVKAQQLCKELQQYKKEGIRLLLNGSPSSPEEIARTCTIREDRCYMRDYISNDSNEIWGIGFDFVKDIK